MNNANKRTPDLSKASQESQPSEPKIKSFTLKATKCDCHTGMQHYTLDPVIQEAIDNINYGKILSKATGIQPSNKVDANTELAVRKPKEGGVKANELDSLLEKVRWWTNSKQELKEFEELKAKLESLIATRTVEAKLDGAKGYVKWGYGERCKSKDTVDFPDLKENSRCPVCEEYEHLDEYTKELAASLEEK